MAAERWKNSVASVSASTSWTDEDSIPAGRDVFGTVDTVFSIFSLSVSRFVEAVSKREWRAVVRESNIGSMTNLLVP